MLEHLREGKKRERVWPMRGKARKRRAGAKRKAGPKFPADGAITNLEAVERLGELGATLDELSVFFQCSQPTISQRFRDYPELKQAWDRGKALANISMRRLLFQKALGANAAGAQASLFLARKLLWPDNGDDYLVKTPASPEEIPSQALDHLTTTELETLAKLMEKLTPATRGALDATPAGGE